MATIATLAGRYRLARDETTGLLRDLLDVELSEGTFQVLCERVSSAATAPVEELQAALPSATQVFVDETGWKQRGVRHWLWTASTANEASPPTTKPRATCDLRPAVMWWKGSIGTRSEAGSRFESRILSDWATCKTRALP